jgi:hypothetical protein
MKQLFIPFVLLAIIFGCEEVIDAELKDAEAPVVIDAWLYRKAEPQTISVRRANPYFDQEEPTGLSGATVTVTDLDDLTVIPFIEESPGNYVWNPTSPTDSFGVVGHRYALNVELNNINFSAFSQINRVPKVDSITWRLEEGNAFFDDSYFGEFWAKDFEGGGDVYWIKAWKNGQLLAKPSELIIAYDAGFSEDGNADGLIFIQPIRDAINPFDLDNQDRLVPPYELPEDPEAADAKFDSAYVEINSITPDAFFFLQQVQVQTNRPGGFGELFATPLANIESNIVSDTKGINVVGYFCTSAVSGLGRKFTEDAIFEDE